MPLLQRCLAGALCVLASLSPLPLAAAEGASSAEPLDRIVAVVNDGVILASELEAEIVRVRQRLQREDRDLPDPGVLRERVLEELVLQELQLQQARQRGISVDSSAVNEALRNMAANNNTDLAGLRERVRAQGLTFERLRADVREQLIISRLRQRTVASQVTVSEQQVDDFLTRVDRASEERQQYRLQHILVGLPSDASTEAVASARQRARAIVAELEGGAEFSTTASRISDGPQALSGGDLGWRRPAELPELFADALAEVGPGEIVGPLRSPNGFHILKLADQRGGTGGTVTQARVRQILVNEDGETDPRERLAELRRRLQAGAEFADLARAHSEHQPSSTAGGDLGWVAAGDLPPVVHEVIRNLPPGQISEPFQSPMGWHLVEVLERREQRDADQQRRTQARQALYERQMEEESQRWLQQLRDSAYVDIRIDE